MNDNSIIFYNMLNAFLRAEEFITDEKVEEKIKELRELSSFSNLSEEKINEVKNKFMANNSIKMSRGNCINEDYEYKKWFLSKKHKKNMKYWSGYKEYLEQDKQFPLTVVNTIDTITDSLVDLLGDPSTEKEYNRKGLVIGDVQSGKTSNYIGLICKAADVGYKVIVVLTGTIEKLRKQTQMRVDEGFIGKDSDAIMRKKFSSEIGAGKCRNDRSIPVALTSVSNDFKISNAKTMSATIDSFSEPLVFIVKKNVSTLKNLNRWLETFNKENRQKIEHPLLVIDDESDNASVNTNNEDKDATAINAQIRALLSLFNKSSYVGFTATPFANIFINPDTDDEMLKDDLFPKDYIYSLNPPSNYVGARDIFSEEGEFNSMYKEINVDEINKYLPIKHKKTDKLIGIPNDLKYAVRTFFIANVIRDLRGDKNTHRSMLINVSRFNDMQKQVETYIIDYLKEIQDYTKVYGKSNEESVKINQIMKSLQETFELEYKNCGFEWKDVKENLYNSIAGIEVKVINQKSGGDFDYDNYEEGARVIAIGGLSLSRGLTLEGLIVSYFYRNSRMYDTLMQMGRWFGYRDKYADLCRIWMTEESYEWYKYISESTDEFRADIKRYQDSRFTPKDFGIRVRSSIPGLLVTARNKMRTAKFIERAISLSGTVLETPYFYKERETRKKNLGIIDRFSKKLSEEIGEAKKISKKASNYMFSGVSSDDIISLINELEISQLNQRFDVDMITNFIENNKKGILEKWDVVFKSGESKITPAYPINNEASLQYVRRALNEKRSDDKIIVLKSNRLGSSDDGKFGLSEQEINDVKRNFIEANEKENVQVPQKEYFKIKRKPMLIIYMLDLEIEDEKEFLPFVGLSIGIPMIDEAETVYVKYAINKIHQNVGELDFDEGDEGEE